MTRLLRWGVAALLLVATACGGGIVESTVPDSSVPIVASATAAAAVKIVLKPASAVFSSTGSSSTASFTATESGFKGTFTARNGCGTAATVTPAKAKGPKATFRVTPLAYVSSCDIDISDGKHSVTFPVAVALPAPRTSPASLTFTATGAANARHFIVSEAGYDGTLTQTNGCRNSARVSPPRARGPSAKFTVTPLALVGACAVTVTDAAGRAATVLVSVLPTTPMPLVVSPASLAFEGVGAAQAASISVSEQNYAGNFTASSTSCSGIASLGSRTLRPSDSTGIATDLVTPVAVGSCSISVSDSNGQSVSIPVTVTTTSVGVH
jgi:hypothetical protein